MTIGVFSNRVSDHFHALLVSLRYIIDMRASRSSGKVHSSTDKLGIVDKLCDPSREIIERAKVDLSPGSSQHGNACLAQDGYIPFVLAHIHHREGPLTWNWVTAV